MRKKKENRNRKTAVLLAAALTLSGLGSGVFPQMEALAAPAAESAEEEEEQEEIRTEEVISITSVEEFLDFAGHCVSESYSKGKMFVLETDVNLQGTEFEPIPVFAGTFDGKGHGIAGLSVHSSGSGLGLFRYVQEGAIVKDLQVQGTLAPQGSRINIGGIAGVNRGTIEGCIFGGHITGQESAGGIAGYNEETGVIKNCENHAVLTGNLKTGGIAGFNEGLIEGCTNLGEVNGTDQENSGGADGQLTMGSIDLEENLRVERVNDAGGIAGLSLGTIRGCTNQAAVGYPHMGYNLGGIAGRHSGIIDECRNYGTIQGRKDVGGITGQFEPYLTVKYEEDMFGSLESQLDELSSMGDSMSSILEQTGDTASSNLDAIDSQLEKIKDIGRFYKNLYRGGTDDFDRDADLALDEIQHILDHMDLELTGWETQARYRSAQEKVKEIQKLREQMKTNYDGDINDLNALKNWLRQRKEQTEQLIKYGTELGDDLLYLATNAPGEAIGGAEAFGDDLEKLQVEVTVFTDIVRTNGDKLKGDLDSMDDEMTAALDILSGNVDTLTDDLKDNRNQIRSQKNQIQDQIDQMRGTISDGVDRAREDKDLIEDVSDLETGETQEGIIKGCVNQGKVAADFQAGGIVGIIGMETSLDPEQDLEADEERTLNVTRNMRAIVTGCINRQQIEVKNDYAGGIAGKANLGALIQNQNYGDITAEDGNYAGGITGSSAYVLRDNYNMCTIHGNNYMGGIAGWGTDVIQNYSMVSFGNREGEWIGAVAGDVDREGTIEGNVYVDEGTGAVDNITYESQAKGLGYEAFRMQDGMPEEFSRLSVEFLVDDEVVKTVYCQYGDGVKESDIPKVPQKDGYYYMWEQKDLSCIKGNEKVHAVYKAWNTTIASSDDKMPVMLVESNFYPGTSLVVREKDKDAWNGRMTVPEGYEMAGDWEYSIVQPDGAAMPEHIRVHVLAKGLPKGSLAGMAENGEIRVADSRWDGSYLVFETNGPGEIVVLRPKSQVKMWIAMAVGAVTGALILWIIAAGRGKKKQGKAGGEEEARTETAEEGEEKEEKKEEEEAEEKAEEMGRG